MTYDLQATVKAVLPVVTGMGQRGPWGKATVVVEFPDGRYNSTLALENMNEYEDFAKLRVGQRGTFSVSVTSREWNGRWFTSARCLKWTMEGEKAPAQPISAPPQPSRTAQAYKAPTPPPPAPAQTAEAPASDDLPF